MDVTFLPFLLSVILLSFFHIITFQSPRPLSQSDLETALVSSRKTKVVAKEYAGLGSHRSESSDPRIQAVLNELSKFGISPSNVGSEEDDS